MVPSTAGNDFARPEPFLRWVGGKQKLARTIRALLPRDVLHRRYFEPFLGAGSVYFSLCPENAIVSDSNPYLMNCYNHIKQSPEDVNSKLQVHASYDSVDYYLEIRGEFNKSRNSLCLEQAARFIYLNRTCFNGIFRVNKRGEFNVPYGFKKAPRIPGLIHLLSISEALKDTKLNTVTFEQALTECQEGDFIYLDPPYPPLDDTSNFNHYTPDRFRELDQLRLAEAMGVLDKRGCLFLMSNADIPLIRKLYSGFSIIRIDVRRLVTCKNKKHTVSELMITNYIVDDEQLSIGGVARLYE